MTLSFENCFQMHIKEIAAILKTARKPKSTRGSETAGALLTADLLLYKPTATRNLFVFYVKRQTVVRTKKVAHKA